jgi:hypothetical protein
MNSVFLETIGAAKVESMSVVSFCELHEWLLKLTDLV